MVADTIKPTLTVEDLARCHEYRHQNPACGCTWCKLLRGYEAAAVRSIPVIERATAYVKARQAARAGRWAGRAATNKERAGLDAAAEEEFNELRAAVEGLSDDGAPSLFERWQDAETEIERLEAAAAEERGRAEQIAQISREALRAMEEGRDRERERADSHVIWLQTCDDTLRHVQAERDRLAARVAEQDTLLADARSGMEWALSDDTRLGFWACDCDPDYEYDTNAAIHGDNCASLWEGHFEATVERLRAALSGGEGASDGR